MKASTERWAWIGGAAAAVAAAVGVTLYATKSASAAPAPTGPSPSTWNQSNAIQILLANPPGSTIVPVGASLQAVGAPSLWVSPGVTSSDNTVLAPSQPATTNGFVAMKPGTATLTGTYSTWTGPNPTDVTYTTISAVVTVTSSVGGVRGGNGGGATNQLCPPGKHWSNGRCVPNAPPPPPAIATPGPYNAIPSLTMQANRTYLLEAPPTSGMTLAQALQHMTTANGVTVLQSWDVGPAPAGWPSTAANVWRAVVTYGPFPTGTGMHVHPPFTVQDPGAKLWSTRGAAV